MALVDIYARHADDGFAWIPKPIDKTGPLLNYDATLEEVYELLTIYPQVWIYDSATQTIIDLNNLSNYFPDYDPNPGGGGGSGSTSDTYTRAQIDTKIAQVNAKITTLNETKANLSSVYSKTEINNMFYNKTEIDTLLEDSGGNSTLSKELVASETIGVITPGKTYAKGTDLETIIRDILIKYTKPGCTLAITPSATLYDAVTSSVAQVTLTAVVKKNTEDVVNVKFYVNDTVVQTITTNVKSGGTFTYVYKPATPINESIKFSASASDSQSTTTSSINVVFIGRSYYGTVGSDISQPTESQVKALNTTLKNSKAYSYSGITMDYGKVVYAYPKSLGALTKIMDNVNNINYTTTFARTELKIDNIDYYVYTQIDPSAADDIKIDFT